MATNYEVIFLARTRVLRYADECKRYRWRNADKEQAFTATSGHMAQRDRSPKLRPLTPAVPRFKATEFFVTVARQQECRSRRLCLEGPWRTMEELKRAKPHTRADQGLNKKRSYASTIDQKRERMARTWCHNRGTTMRTDFARHNATLKSFNEPPEIWRSVFFSATALWWQSREDMKS